MQREFPFKADKEKKDVETALHVFELLWHNHEKRNGKLSTKALNTVFHKYVSDSVTFDGGWRRGKYWSPEAWELACEKGSTGGLGLKCEHVIPRACVLAHAMELDTYQAAKDFVVNNSFVCVITAAENDMLNAAKLGSSHPNVEDPWARYSVVSTKLERSIMVLDVPGFLTDAEREQLNKHRLLEPIGARKFVPVKQPL